MAKSPNQPSDLVAYEHKHNEANGEDNRDGTDDNRSWNCGAEGPTDDPEIIALRARRQRNMLATLLLSEGVPMLSGGDELGRTQSGNNNAYCQDNAISWYDWALDPERERLLGFTRRLIALRRDNPVFHRRAFLTGRQTMDSGLPDVAWFRPDGRPMAERNWRDPEFRTLAVFLGCIAGSVGRPGPVDHAIGACGRTLNEWTQRLAERGG